MKFAIPFFAAVAAVVSATAIPQGAELQARQFSGTESGQATWFNPALGACGITNTDSDYITAISHQIFNTYPGFVAGSNPNNNPICGHRLAVSYGGKTVDVTITDLCGSCTEFDLDLSPAAFSSLADEGLGRIPVTWTWL
ncbi:barwin-like endoglucanase [Clavulina sp. PMI_390]|nr:barwin-like endoglucanase [Clavulina sp. PMI_390]